MTGRRVRVRRGCHAWGAPGARGGIACAAELGWGGTCCLLRLGKFNRRTTDPDLASRRQRGSASQPLTFLWTPTPFGPPEPFWPPLCFSLCFSIGLPPVFDLRFFSASAFPSVSHLFSASHHFWASHPLGPSLFHSLYFLFRPPTPFQPPLLSLYFSLLGLPPILSLYFSFSLPPLFCFPPLLCLPRIFGLSLFSGSTFSFGLPPLLGLHFFSASTFPSASRPSFFSQPPLFFWLFTPFQPSTPFLGSVHRAGCRGGGGRGHSLLPPLVFGSAELIPFFSFPPRSTSVPLLPAGRWWHRCRRRLQVPPHVCTVAFECLLRAKH